MEPTSRPHSQMSFLDQKSWKAAQKLEASFLSEMLKSTGLGNQKNSFSGGIGEEQFSSFMREALAEKMVQAGGVGLAEIFFDTMKESNVEK